MPLLVLYLNMKGKDLYSHLQLFGCLCYIIVPKEKQDNFTSKTRICLFLGYTHNSTTLYKVMDAATRHIFTTTQVKFDDQQFPGLPTLPNEPPNPNLSPYDPAYRLPTKTPPKATALPKAKANANALPKAAALPKSGNKRQNKTPSSNSKTKKPRSSKSTGNRKCGTSGAARAAIRMPEVPGLEPTRAITHQMDDLSIPERRDASSVGGPEQLVADSSSQLVPTNNSPSSSSATATAACGHSVLTVNLASGLTYFDLVEDELSASIRDTPISSFSWPTVLMTALSHGRKDS